MTTAYDPHSDVGPMAFGGWNGASLEHHVLFHRQDSSHGLGTLRYGFKKLQHHRVIRWFLRGRMSRINGQWGSKVVWILLVFAASVLCQRTEAQVSAAKLTGTIADKYG